MNKGGSIVMSPFHSTAIISTTNIEKQMDRRRNYKANRNLSEIELFHHNIKEESKVHN
jgi:hypothetical protein